MSEVPSLWYDLGLNYYHQSSLTCPSGEDQNSSSLLLEKAKQVIHTVRRFYICLIQKGGLLRYFSGLFSVFKKVYHDGQWEP